MGREDGLRRRVDLGQLVDERGGDERLEGVVADAVDDGDRDAGDVDQVGERVGAIDARERVRSSPTANLASSTCLSKYRMS